MQDWKSSSNIILVYYTSYAGGKFVINSLGFSHRCCPAIDIDIQKDKYNNLKLKIPSIFKTIPPNKQECLKWAEYELRCDLFWKFNYHEYQQFGAVYLNRVPDVVKHILEDRYCFIVVHADQLLADYRCEFPNAKVLQIYNYNEFIKIASPLKGGLPFTAVGQPDVAGDFLFDMHTIFNWTKFKHELDRCCDWLNIDAIDSNELVQYYQQYIALHDIAFTE
jgi:hypothetical protein